MALSVACVHAAALDWTMHACPVSCDAVFFPSGEGLAWARSSLSHLHACSHHVLVEYHCLVLGQTVLVSFFLCVVFFFPWSPKFFQMLQCVSSFPQERFGVQKWLFYVSICEESSFMTLSSWLVMTVACTCSWLVLNFVFRVLSPMCCKITITAEQKLNRGRQLNSGPFPFSWINLHG